MLARPFELFLETPSNYAPSQKMAQVLRAMAGCKTFETAQLDMSRSRVLKGLSGSTRKYAAMRQIDHIECHRLRRPPPPPPSLG